MRMQSGSARRCGLRGIGVLFSLSLWLIGFHGAVNADTYLFTEPVPIATWGLLAPCTGFGDLNRKFTPPQCFYWPGASEPSTVLGPPIAGREAIYAWAEANSPLRNGWSGDIEDPSDPVHFPQHEVCVFTHWQRGSDEFTNPYYWPTFNVSENGFYDCVTTFPPASGWEPAVSNGVPAGAGASAIWRCPPGFAVTPWSFCVKAIAQCTSGCGQRTIPTVAGTVDPSSGVVTDESVDYVSPSSLRVVQRHSSEYAEGQTVARQPWLVASNTTNTSPSRYISFVHTDAVRGTTLKVYSKVISDSLWANGPTVDLYLGSRSYRFTSSGTAWVGDPHFLLSTSAAAEGTRYAVADASASERLVFDDNGRVLERKSADGRTYIRYTYRTSTLAKYPADAPDCGGSSQATLQLTLKCQVDSFGRSVAYNSDADGNLIKATLPDGHAITYSYSSGGLHTQTRFDDGSGSNLHYAEAGFASPVGWTNAGQQQLTGVSSVSSTGTVARLVSYRYDDLGRASGSERPGLIDQYTIQYPQSNGAVITEPSGATSAVAFGWTPLGTSLASRSQGSGSGSVASVLQNFYDGYGNLAQHNDYTGQLSCHWYDNTRALELTRLEGVTVSCPSPGADPAAGTTQRKTWTTWHPYWNFKSREAAPKLITTWVYNGQPDPSNGNAVLTCAPTTALVGDQPIAVLCKRVEQATSDDNGTLGFSAVSVGNPRTWAWTYNQWGQKLTENGPRTDVTDTSSWSYYSDTTADHMPGDLQQATNALGQITQYPKYDRNGRVLKMIAADGAITEYLYHVRGWLTQVKVTPAGGGTAQLTNITYEPTGKVKRVTQPDASWVENTYDAAQRLVSQKDNLNNVVAYTLDNSGNRIKEEYRDSTASLKRNIERSYDALNRLQASIGQ